MQGLPQLTARGGMYLGMRYGFGILIGLGNMLVLTWWIGPHAYGLFVMALGLSAFLASLSRAGADTYLVRLERTPDNRLYQVALTVIGCNAVALLGVGAGLAPLLVRWFGNKELLGPYLATLLTVPLVGWAGPPTAKLERALAFGKIAGIELGGQMLALGVSLILAWRHLGVWAPVGGLLAWQTWAMVAALRAARLVPRMVFDWGETRDMLSFGIGYTMSLRAWQLRTLVNPLMVGRFAGTEGVAFVGLAIRIAEGLGFIRIAAARLAIAALSRLRDQPSKLREALQRGLELQVATLGPLLCLFATAGPFVVARLMGLRWLPSLSVYPWIAAAVLVNSVYNLQASALFVAGEQWTVFRAYGAHVAVLGLATWVLLPRLGIVGYGWADMLACGAYYGLHARLAKRLNLSYRRLGRWTIALLICLFASIQPSPLIKALSWTPVLLFVAIELEQWRKRGTLARASRAAVFEEEAALATAGD